MSDEKTMTADDAIEEITQVGEFLQSQTGRATDPPQGVSGISTQELAAKDKGGTGQTKSPAALVPVTAGGIMVSNLEELMRFAAMIVRDGAAPKGMTQGQAAVAIQAGLERRLGLLGGLTQGVVINGVFSWRGQGAIALIQNSGLCKPGTLDKWHEGDGEEKKGVAVGHRVGYKQAARREFSVKDAKRAGLWGKSGPWHNYPERQLEWRALGFLARDVFPDVLGGFPLMEEAVDFDEPERGRAQVSVRPESPPPSGPDNLLDAIEGKAPAAQGKAVDAAGQPDSVAGGELLCPHGIPPHGIPIIAGEWVAGECEDCAREDKAAVLEAEAKEVKEQ